MRTRMGGVSISVGGGAGMWAGTVAAVLLLAAAAVVMQLIRPAAA